jgi:hypothetical protein
VTTSSNLAGLRKSARPLAILLAGALCLGAARAGTEVVTSGQSRSMVVPPPMRSVPLREVEFPFAQPRMRVAKENPAARTPPRLPHIVQVTEPEALPEPTPTPAAQATPTPAPAATSTSVSVKIQNPLLEALDFFRGAAIRADRDTLDGTLFDPTFRPALPPMQPASSATYQETP